MPHPPHRRTVGRMEDGSLMSATSDKLRIVVVFRADLPMMTPPKAEVQFGHAVAAVLRHAWKTDPALVDQYFEDNQPKLSMEVPSLADLEKIAAKAAKRGVPHFLVTDAAHTVFDAPTVTCIGLGPMTKTDGNALTRDARMRSSVYRTADDDRIRDALHDFVAVAGRSAWHEVHDYGGLMEVHADAIRLVGA